MNNDLYAALRIHYRPLVTPNAPVLRRRKIEMVSKVEIEETDRDGRILMFLKTSGDGRDDSVRKGLPMLNALISGVAMDSKKSVGIGAELTGSEAELALILGGGQSCAFTGRGTLRFSGEASDFEMNMKLTMQDRGHPAVEGVRPIAKSRTYSIGSQLRLVEKGNMAVDIVRMRIILPGGPLDEGKSFVHSLSSAVRAEERKKSGTIDLHLQGPFDANTESTLRKTLEPTEGVMVSNETSVLSVTPTANNATMVSLWFQQGPEIFKCDFGTEVSMS
ncbi:hypothetical protein FOZ63_012808 [Perkinsus olseni]|uniref:Uncharacterized protein n=1 Tax=Perkinsus olseni TaxID=32597 RepID=A0A7J6PVI8_PEROL|nr:hypothetical protein FOZ63_012808 [Perkinsus olseni]KAF4743853.1 hypothetical protein FOZ62_005922 [Perkinsus olseni]